MQTMDVMSEGSGVFSTGIRRHLAFVCAWVRLGLLMGSISDTM